MRFRRVDLGYLSHTDAPAERNMLTGRAILAIAALACVAPVAIIPAVTLAIFGFFVASPSAGLATLSWLLPVHALAMAVLFGALQLSGPVVRSIAAWKEVLALLLVAASLVRAARPSRGMEAEVIWVDLTVVAFLLVVTVHLVSAPFVPRESLPLEAQLYGARDAGFFLLLYFVGRGATAPGAESWRPLTHLALVGAVTSLVACFELAFVPPELLVLIGATRYFQDFLGVAAFTSSNDFGLPDNYWTRIGDQLVRRTGSTYLSSQAFALPFLLIIPATTVLVLYAPFRHRRSAWVALLCAWTGLILTVARMTIAACALETFALLLIHRRLRTIFTVACATGVVGVAIVASLPNVRSFMWDTLTWQSESSVGHLEDWGKGFGAVMDHPLGAGLATADQTAVRFGVVPLSADSQYLKFGAELGAVGLLLHLLLLAGVAVYSLRAFRYCPTAVGRAHGAFVFAATVGLAVNATSTVVYNSTMFAYVYFWLAGSVVSTATTSSRLRLDRVR